MQTNFLRFLVTLLGLSYVLSVSAIPATRTKNLSVQDAAVMPSIAPDSLNMENGEEMLVDMDEEFMKRRIDLEIQDYGGTGANRDHEPKAPGIGR
ncbi:hypothetical protein RIF29_19652 [Crotalaria pallida]|uniref:Uncharacterized protein n=1 Tax=Crotalaria pallida TaxID=3830 RepID=A0AAN9F253_CROPI